MQQKETTIVNSTGLHARPAAEFVAAAKKYESKITIGKVGEEKRVNAKSIVLMLSLGVSQGTKVEIAAEGPDEREAVDGLVALLDSGFGEL